MPTNEKEYNGYLFDQLALLKRLERVAKNTDNVKDVLDEIAFEREFIEQKLYQNPALTNNNDK
jgi:hypothetical protein